MTQIARGIARIVLPAVDKDDQENLPGSVLDSLERVRELRFVMKFALLIKLDHPAIDDSITTLRPRHGDLPGNQLARVAQDLLPAQPTKSAKASAETERHPRGTTFIGEYFVTCARRVISQALKSHQQSSPAFLG